MINETTNVGYIKHIHFRKIKKTLHIFIVSNINVSARKCIAKYLFSFLKFPQFLLESDKFLIDI